jgi:preprotein translocase subunit YajC
MLRTFLLLAEAPAENAQSPTTGFTSMLLPMVAIAMLAYFILIRPMKRQEQERQSLISNLKKNDEVITSGGLIGIVASIKEKGDEVTLKVDESANVRIRVTKNSIVRVVNKDEPSKELKEGSA